jgi:hypothetical protein
MLQGVPISMDVVIVLHSLRAGGRMAHQKIQQQEDVQTHNNQMRREVLQLFKISLLTQKMTKIRIPTQ